MEYIINCTGCGSPKSYATKRSYDTAKYNLKKKGHSYCFKCLGKRYSNELKGKKSKITKRTYDKKFFKKCPTCDRNQGFTSKKTMVESIRLNKSCLKCTGKDNGKRLNDMLTQEMRLKAIATREGFMSYEEYWESLKHFKRYLLKVWRFTYKQPLETLENFNKRGKSGVPGAYQVDHKISIKDGYKMNIPEEQIASIENLQMLPWEENRKKWSSSIWHI